MIFIFQSRRRYFNKENHCASSICQQLQQMKGPAFCLFQYHIENSLSREDALSPLGRIPEGCITPASDLNAEVDKKFPPPQVPST